MYIYPIYCYILWGRVGLTDPVYNEDSVQGDSNPSANLWGPETRAGLLQRLSPSPFLPICVSKHFLCCWVKSKLLMNTESTLSPTSLMYSGTYLKVTLNFSATTGSRLALLAPTRATLKSNKPTRLKQINTSINITTNNLLTVWNKSSPTKYINNPLY